MALNWSQRINSNAYALSKNFWKWQIASKNILQLRGMEEITQVFNSCVFEIWWLSKSQKDDVFSLSLNSSFAILSQFIFNLRRSQFVQVFNNSPNETAYFCMLLNRNNVTNFIVYFCWMHTLVLLSFMVWLLLSGTTWDIIINHSIRNLLNYYKHLMMMHRLLSRNDFLHLDWFFVINMDHRHDFCLLN